MGLAVRTYGNIKLAENEDDYAFTVFVIADNWKHKIKNLEYGKCYTGDSIFRGVSYPYSAHNRFREILVKLVDRPDLLETDGGIKWSELPSDIPFNALIDFSDNEGCLDWEISGIIYSDFEKYNEKAKAELHEYDYSRYVTWMKTFEAAKNNQGVVVF